MDPRVALRAEVKLARKKLDKLVTQKQAIENKVRSALTLGQRDAAEKFAIHLNEIKQDCQEAELRLQQCEHMERVGRRDLANFKQDMKRAQQLGILSQANKGLANALDKISEHGEGRVTDEMTRRIHEKAALGEARLDLAMEDAASKNPELSMSPEVKAQSEAMEAEDILRQIEMGMNIEPDY